MVMALSQCSTRISSPKRWLGQRATSPAATTPGAARVVASHTTPSSRARPEPSSQPGVRRDADAHDHEVGVDERAVGQPDVLDAVAALEPGDADAEAEVDAVVAVQVAHHRAHLVAERPAERHGQRLEDRDVAARDAAGGRHLGADEPGADDHDPPAPPSSAARTARESSSVRSVWTPASVSVPGRRAGRGAGGDDQPVEGHLAAAGQVEQPAAVDVEAGGPRAEPPVEVEAGEPAASWLTASADALDLPRARQHLLGQRRPVVGLVRSRRRRP